MLQAGHLSACHARVCGCQLQSRKVQARSPRGCSIVRAATAVPSEVSHAKVGLGCCKHNAAAAHCVEVAAVLQYKTVSPVGDRVYVKVNVSEETTSSGLLLPVSSQKKPTQGEVVGAGTAKAVKVSGSSLVGNATL